MSRKVDIIRPAILRFRRQTFQTWGIAGYSERNAGAALLAGSVSIATYAAIVGAQFGSQAVGDIDWFWPMLWTIVGSIAGSAPVSTGLGMLAGIRYPNDRSVEDVRDRDIARLGDRVGQAFLVIAMISALLLCVATAEWFRIANVLYAGLALSAVVGGITRVVVYRRGMP